MNRREIQETAYTIAEEYGGDLTVRQLYYQFVARGLIDNGDKSYRRIQEAVTAARLSGDFPFRWIVDRTRTCHGSSAFTDDTDVDDAASQVGGYIANAHTWAIQRARWFGQRTYVTVGVEKEALAGVFERPCGALGVGLFVFRGYSSVSALWQFCRHLTRACHEGIDRAVLLYFGDHDPDGWEIPRSAMRNLSAIEAADDDIELPDIELERVALTMRQIRRYSPPPFAAKVSSSRYQGYVDEHDTDDAWELDALRPDVLRQLIRDSVDGHFDESVAYRNQELVKERRAELRARMREPGWVSDYLTD